MKLKEIRNSLSTRLSLWIVFFAAAIFVAALGYVTVVARRAVRREAIQGAKRVLENTVIRVNGILEDVELVADNLEGRIYQNLDKPDVMFDLSREVVLTNSFLFPSNPIISRKRAAISRPIPTTTENPSTPSRKARTVTSIFIWTGICCPSSWASLAGQSPIQTRRSSTTAP